MAWEQPLWYLSFQAAADLSSYQHEVVRMTTTGKVNAVTSAGMPLVGVLQNNPTSGNEAKVMAIGVTKIKAGGAIGRGGKVKVNATSTSNAGTVIAATSDVDPRTVGYALEASAQAGDIITAVINFKI